jgi:hypothetical protein
MWRAVLSQAIKDLYGTSGRDRIETIRWLKSDDFPTVCDFANVEAESMRIQLLNIANMPFPLALKYGKQLSDLVMYSIHGA